MSQAPARRVSNFLERLNNVRGSPVFIPGCGILFLVLFVWLYATNISLYMRILVWMMREPFPHPFIDWEWIPSAVHCWARGVDVYLDNTCYGPVAHGRHNYSPLWLRMGLLARGEDWLAPVGLSFAVLFFISLTTLPPQQRLGPFCATFLATFSSLTVFALERANVDLIMFLLAVAGVNLWMGSPKSRLAGYGIFILAGLLKFYPFVLLVLALRERPRVFAGITVTTLAVLATFGLTYHTELARIAKNIPGGSPFFGDMFAASDLPYGVAIMLCAPETGAPGFLQRHAGHAGLALLMLTAFACAFKVARDFKLGPMLLRMPRRELGLLLAGAALTCACFFTGHSVGYRAIMLLPALPGLLWLSVSLPSRRGRWLFTTAAWAIVFVMWVIFFQQLIAVWFPPFGTVGFVHWILNQLAWWFVVTMLLATLLGYFPNSQTGREIPSLL